MNFMPDEKLKNLLLEVNNQGNNPPMVCVIYNRNEILKKFLMFLFSTKHITDEEVGEFLHQRNVYNDTILSLVLQHENTQLLPQMLLLEKEKEIHTKENKKETMLELTSCLRNNDLRSAEVASTIARVDKSYEKITFCEKFKIWILILVTILVMPLSIQGTDMGFDVLVVYNYWEDTKNDNQTNNTFSGKGNCKADVPDNLSHIPDALESIPKFAYSLSFIIIPWLFYVIEFCISRYFKKTEKEVSINT